MVEIANSARKRLEAGKVAAGIGLRQARTVDIAPAMKTAGFDWLFIDLEHNAMSLDMAVQISVAANGVGIAPIVRVPNGQYDMATRVLDGGAMGIVIPHVDTGEEAATVADRLRYPPQGHRSVAGGMPQLNFAPVSNAEAAAAFNKAMLVVVMLETPTAIANADAIAAVPGIDVLMIGTSDLTMEMGLSGQLTHPDVVAAYETVIAACKKHGKWAGMGGVYVEEPMKKYVDMGVRMILSGNDLSLLMAAATQRAKFVASFS
ncbi:2-keto-3-deoxy-L-rhamnonate aldolase RhmA [Stella humosa]|uniref:2-keto-3-deoxy-L-rhamnonate aldolase RhmA n=1 Tax=Stella humosa TaxID=94 RepID=A0A3N1KX50_9PROT|nr:aldolase/citrate lyase family protein [Stella humosa]ROP83797.1 2-keto-3-deoxy-L-rhamnonate aldolase RhmA [Stella humosa]BBK32942.1 aldolase [Stella humosa]